MLASCRDCGTDLPGRRRVCDACKAKNKTTPSPPPPVVEPAEAPAGLHRRGRALWSALGEEVGTSAGEVALEACRTADRLDELDRIIAGKGVLRLMKFRLNPDWWDEEGEQHVHVTVGFQSVLSEARMQQVAFKELMKDLRAQQKVAAATNSPGPQSGSSSSPAPQASTVDQLAERRQQRGSKSG